jgi:hypothetical protein
VKLTNITWIIWENTRDLLEKRNIKKQKGLGIYIYISGIYIGELCIYMGESSI